jgi:carboxyl-terminal processing protease
MLQRKLSFPILLLTIATLAFCAGAFARFLVLSERTIRPQERLMSASARGISGGDLTVAQVGEPDSRTFKVAEANSELFSYVYDRLKQKYVHEITDDRAFALASVRSMLASLNDPQSYLVPAESAQDYLDQRLGNYHGIGAGLMIRSYPDPANGGSDLRLAVISPVAGGPAERAGIRPGDRIEKVNGKTVLSLDGFYRLIKTEARFEELTHSVDAATLPLVLERLQERGEVDLKDKMSIEDAMLLLIGSHTQSVDVAVRRGTSKKLLDFKLDCEPFAPERVSSGRDGQVGTIAIHSFGEGTAQGVQAALSEFAASGIKKLVIDLRDNPGGSLAEAAKVAGLFIESGPISRIRCNGKVKQTLDLTAGAKPSGDLRLVVLSNGGTGGSAEVLAGALADRAGARLAGANTCGDSSWTDSLTLDDGSTIVQFTGGTLLTPNGSDYSGIGLKPQVALKGADSYDPAVRERVRKAAVGLL